ncbi:hypothetical protein Q7C36_007247 [Tachysurus vachellii]|uniref:Uncharacterized protein n=1 Tax=Tachysurus vachellii TaxID=175792 RepID=A0AA88SYF6_TACVA|nr:hypothetical protein Q7C36_007247 [Tachysurus vachellii]
MASLFAIRMAINKGTLEGTLSVFFHVEKPIGALQQVFTTGRAHETAPHHVFSRPRSFSLRARELFAAARINAKDGHRQLTGEHHRLDEAVRPRGS